MKYLFLALACLVASSWCQEEAEDVSASLLISKNVLNKYLVQSKDITIEYNIYNVGDGPAYEVSLRDASFPPNDFEVVSGLLEAKWDRIPAGGNVTHAVIMKAITPGYFNFTSADISYLVDDKTQERQVAYSSAPGEGGIVNLKDYDRVFSPHVADWLVFALMTLPSLAFPYMLWMKSYNQYNVVKSKSS